MIQGDMGTMGMGTVWGHLVCGQDMAGGTRVCVWQWVGAVAVHMCVRVPVRPLVCPGVPSSVPVYPGVSIPVSPRVPMCPHVSPDPCGCPQASGDRLLSEKVQQGGSPKLGPGVHGCHHPGDMGAVALGTWVPPSWDHGCHHPRAIGPPPPHPEDVGTTTLGTWVATTLRTWVATTLGTWVPPLWGHGCHHFGDTGPHLGFPLQIAPQLRSQQLI